MLKLTRGSRWGSPPAAPGRRWYGPMARLLGSASAKTAEISGGSCSSADAAADTSVVSSGWMRSASSGVGDGAADERWVTGAIGRG
nr:unnamed protein product [Digitaria exilis]